MNFLSVLSITPHMLPLTLVEILAYGWPSMSSGYFSPCSKLIPEPYNLRKMVASVRVSSPVVIKMISLNMLAEARDFLEIQMLKLYILNKTL